ncbi:MAG: tetratricopeptide repeat protein [Gemmataceae bacterium]|nr:tetratricopeptide repeat protein [Gemmataceae bacterium]
MRKLNTRLFLILIAVTLCTGLSIFLVHRLQAGNISEALLWQANQAEKDGRLDYAARFLGRYLEFEPTDLEERAHLAKILTDPRMAHSPKALRRARFVLQQVLARAPQRHELRSSLCRVLLDLMQFDEAKEQLDILEKALPNSADAAELAGEWHLKQSQDKLAADYFRTAVNLAPGKVENHLRLAYVLRRLDRRRGLHTREIEALAATALEKAPSHAAVLILAAELAQERGDVPSARLHLEKGLKEHGRDVRLFQALARLEIQENRRADAIGHLRRGLQAIPKDQRWDLYWTLANVLLDAGDLAEARKVLGEIRELHNSSSATEYLETRCKMVQGRWHEAAKAFERLRPAFKSVPDLAFQVDLYLGGCYEQLEEPTAQLTAFQRALDFDPGSAPARQGLAAAQWQLGQISEAVKQYQALAEHSTTGDIPRRKLDVAQMLLLSQLERDTPDWRAVERALVEAELDNASPMDIVLLRAELAFVQKNWSKADGLLTQALKDDPKKVDLWASRASLAQRAGKKELARQVLEEARKSLGDMVELRLAEVRFWKEQSGKEAEAGLAPLGQNLERFSADEQARLFFGLADAYQDMEYWAAAAEILERVARLPRHAEDIRVQLTLFDLAQKRGDDAAMQKAVADIQQIEGADGAAWRYAEARRQFWLGKNGKAEALEQARQLLTAASTQRPDWHAIALLRAEIDELQGKNEQAIVNYRRAVELGSRNPTATRQLVLLLTQSQRFDEADQEIRRLQRQAPLSGELQKIAVVLSLSKKEFNRAENLARQAVAAAAKDYRNHLWLGQVLFSKGQANAETEDAFRTAIGLAPQQPETWIALVRYLVAIGQEESADKELESAKEKLPAEKLPLTLAHCYEALGKTKLAEHEYQSAVKSSYLPALARRQACAFYLRNNQPVQAKQLLRQVLDRQVNANDDDIVWARRVLALASAASKDSRGLDEAMELVGLSVNDKGQLAEAPIVAPDDALVRAKVLALHPRRDYRARAVALLEESQSRQPLSADDQFLLAQLYVVQSPDAAGWRKSKELLKNLIARQPHPIYLGYYANQLLQRRELIDADSIISRLEQLEKSRKVPPGTFGYVELKAKSYELRGFTQQALKLLQSYANQDESATERLYGLAALHARLGQWEDAIDVCLKISEAPEVALGQAVSLLRSAPPTASTQEAWAKQWQRVEGLLREASEKNPDKVALYLQRADIHDLKDNLVEVEAMCKEVLRRDPKNIVALNNLAWHLAPDPKRALEALDLIDRALKAHGPRPELLDTRAVIFLSMDQTERALADLDNVVQQAPSATRFFHLARAHHQANNRSSAFAALQRANALGLAADRLHRTERDVYQRLVVELN